MNLPASDSRDTAVGNLVTNISDDPVGAFSWSAIVTDPAKRGELLDGVVKRWRRSDPEAARTAIESAEELSPATSTAAIGSRQVMAGCSRWPSNVGGSSIRSVP